MMNKVNYQKALEDIIEQQGERVPRVFLHSCCAPCSSYVLEYLSRYFSITVYYFNPNISPAEEFEKRFEEEKRLISEMKTLHPVSLERGDYNYSDFEKIAKGYEACPEGGERCFRCYRLRLEKTAQLAKEKGYDYFCTTLSISPLKNAQKINEIGFEIAEKHGVSWLPSDFKKKEGYKRSIELSREHNLYRQNFCGCTYSRAAREIKDEQ